MKIPRKLKKELKKELLKNIKGVWKSKEIRIDKVSKFYRHWSSSDVVYKGTALISYRLI